MDQEPNGRENESNGEELETSRAALFGFFFWDLVFFFSLQWNKTELGEHRDLTVQAELPPVVKKWLHLPTGRFP